MAQPPTQGPPSASQGERRSDGKVRVTVKGTRKGLSITLGRGDWPQVLREVDERLRQAAAFFQGSQVNLRTGKRDVDQRELEEVIDILTSHNIELASLETDSTLAAEAAQALGLKLALPEAIYTHPDVPTATDEWSEGLLLRRTLRSGQSLRHPGHVVIVGDVNPGAEVIAGGDVVVWGKLCGVVQAGAVGNDEAIVCALELRPTQLRIGSYIARSPEEKSSTRPGPEIASVLDGQIVAQPWSTR